MLLITNGKHILISSDTDVDKGNTFKDDAAFRGLALGWC
jgi:hypothetical protein